MRVRIKFIAVAAIVAMTASACAPAKERPTGALNHVHLGVPVAAPEWGWSANVAAGAQVSLSLGPYHDVRDYDIKLVSVTPIGGDGSVTVSGVEVAGPQRAIGAGFYTAYPPDEPRLGTLAPAAGFILPGGEPLTDIGYALIVGLTGGGKQRSLINGFHIVYEADGVQYEYNEPAYIAICAPSAATCESNPGPA